MASDIQTLEEIVQNLHGETYMDQLATDSGVSINADSELIDLVRIRLSLCSARKYLSEGKQRTDKQNY